MNARKTLFIVMIFFAPASSAMATDGLEPLNAGTQTPARGGTIETQVAEKPNSNHDTAVNR